MKTALPLCIALLLGLPAQPAPAEPYTPQRDEELVERLPQRLGSAAQRAESRLLRARLQQAPENLPLALQLAREAIARARLQGDPRELGQAQALLAPWWSAAPPPVRLLRATIRQAQHDFGPALLELDGLLATPGVPLPLQAQAELTRAAVLQVRGRWREARLGCTRLAGPHYAALGAAARLHGEVCIAELDGLQGRTEQAEAALLRLSALPGAPQAWIALLRAELAERRGRAEAGPLYRQALQANPEIYPRVAYADWLLRQRRWRDAAHVVLGFGEAGNLPDALLLRLAIAWKQAADPRAGAAAAELQARFDAAAERGDDSHGRERARFALDLRPEPGIALAQAQANWALQKEPADALLLQRAALTAGQPAAAEPLRQFQRETGFADRRLAERAR
ncbi:hypothetical protein [Roseateles violae]|uniref:Tetratricopeptide repeat protein n=1 Tax=Roseateles violae TaxID=3058042 RepID=A0ABT8DXF9_9BURK|nr:hypothetical protein [Pelomonas sp. PFR6]MDN3922138.1 hypothetical protein [Pelomonas sp. PFR6]